MDKDSFDEFMTTIVETLLFDSVLIRPNYRNVNWRQSLTIVEIETISFFLTPLPLLQVHNYHQAAVIEMFFQINWWREAEKEFCWI